MRFGGIVFGAGQRRSEQRWFPDNKTHHSLWLMSHLKLNLLISLQDFVFSVTTEGFCFLFFSPAHVQAVARALRKPTFDCCVVRFDIFKQPVPVHLGRENILNSAKCSNKVTAAYS